MLKGSSVRATADRFQHSISTISAIFREALRSFLHILEPLNEEFKENPTVGCPKTALELWMARIFSKAAPFRNRI